MGQRASTQNVLQRLPSGNSGLASVYSLSSSTDDANLPSSMACEAGSSECLCKPAEDRSDQSSSRTKTSAMPAPATKRGIAKQQIMQLVSEKLKRLSLDEIRTFASLRTQPEPRLVNDDLVEDAYEQDCIRRLLESLGVDEEQEAELLENATIKFLHKAPKPRRVTADDHLGKLMVKILLRERQITLAYRNVLFRSIPARWNRRVLDEYLETQDLKLSELLNESCEQSRIYSVIYALQTFQDMTKDMVFFEAAQTAGRSVPLALPSTGKDRLRLKEGTAC